ncbi:transcriptional regulator with XRE-family HTH domain [Rhodoblastus acidophilus]|uniref:helix-turn-helix transcriptional regulator n=1 Tax=Rhodoblastus acidophilus TaxID=1074 RepID=UPI0022258B91|nr:helix-turn-helix transcriptional regulator [Rhodoblastus acidophilus]MCW2282270.1 transcriptional regulator with XRE-family HTH domain [Rhodoblastus acidophilus]MCW2331325.1 transcriptional regulator with XRE-family HTH domain [Rhodoblastus acidophilus]
MEAATLTLPPKILGFWTKCIRTTMHWSQEALAANSNLTTRTIQRIEAGEPVSITTRRSLARGLGYQNLDVFDDPESVAAIMKLLDGARSQKIEDFQKEFPDHIPVVVKRVANGHSLSALAATSEATLLHCDDAISLQAKEKAACLFDYLRDMVDVWDNISFSDKLRYTQEMENMLRELEALDVAVYQGSRSTKMVGVHWENKTPIPLTIGYLLIAPKDKEISQLMVPRRLS